MSGQNKGGKSPAPNNMRVVLAFTLAALAGAIVAFTFF